MKIIQKYICMFVCGLLLFLDTIFDICGLDKMSSVQAQDNISLYAKAAVLMDAASGRVLYDKNGTDVMPMASTTKIMTLIITLENADLEDTVEVSSYASSMPDVQLNIRTGEKYRLKDLLYSMMLESHNDSAVAIAEQVAGNVENFAELMNKKAKEIGCKNTYFITPNGLDAHKDNKTHSTTATDLALIMSYCITKSPQKDKFLEITRTQSYSFTDLKCTRSFTCNNHNAFLNMMEGALTGKTGFTNAAGYCYVGALKRDGKTFVVALLACGWPGHKSYKWSDTKELMKYGLDNYEYYDFSNIEIPDKAFELIPVLDAKRAKINDTVMLKTAVEKDFENNEENDGILLKEDERIEVRIKKDRVLNAPVLDGKTVGFVEICLNDKVLKKYGIIAVENVEKIDYKWCLIYAIKVLLFK